MGSVAVAASSGRKRQFAAKNRYKTDTTLCLVFPSKPGEIPPKRPVSAQGVPFPSRSRLPLPVPVAFKAHFRMPADALKWDHGEWDVDLERSRHRRFLKRSPHRD